MRLTGAFVWTSNLEHSTAWMYESLFEVHYLGVSDLHSAKHLLKTFKWMDFIASYDCMELNYPFIFICCLFLMIIHHPFTSFQFMQSLVCNDYNVIIDIILYSLTKLTTSGVHYFTADFKLVQFLMQVLLLLTYLKAFLLDCRYLIFLLKCKKPIKHVSYGNKFSFLAIQRMYYFLY